MVPCLSPMTWWMDVKFSKYYWYNMYTLNVFKILLYINNLIYVTVMLHKNVDVLYWYWKCNTCVQNS